MTHITGFSSAAALDRTSIGEMIADRLAAKVDVLRAEFHTTGRVNTCVVDDLLPVGIASRIRDVFPDTSSMRHRSSLREDKYVAAQMNQYHPLLEEIIYAFQAPSVLAQVEKITSISKLIPDERLYAGGISVMRRGNFLNPHLDNSHDVDRKQYRAINALYYVSRNWDGADGGSLELWDNGPKGTPRAIVSAFNHLVIMITNQSSWHSVSKVMSDQYRCCISNYYFSEQSAEKDDYFHVTSFRGRPEEPVKNVILQADQQARTAVRSIFKNGLVPTKHIYNKPPE